MKINFLLPSPGRYPIGGFKIVYQYANQLVNMDYEVYLTYILYFSDDNSPKIERNLLRMLLHYLAKKYTNKYNYTNIKWFTLDKKIKTFYKLPYFINTTIPNADIIIFITYDIANMCNELPDNRGIKTWLIFEFERYARTNNAMKKAYCKIFNNSNILNIATSTSVKSMLEDCGAQESLYLPNFIDFKEFNLDININDKKRNYIGFPSRNESYKGTSDAIKALKLVKKEFPNIKIWSFGIEKPSYFPGWIEFYENPTNKKLRELYNLTKIFVVSSYYEGWGLPGSEAMACGATLVSTRNGGVDSYATDNKTALLSDIKDPKSLANNIIKLLKDDKLRLKLAKEGNKNIKKFNIENSASKLDKYLKNITHLNK